MPTISLRLTDDQATQLEEAARLSGQKVSVWMRAALTDALAGRDPAAQLKELAIIRKQAEVTHVFLHQYVKEVISASGQDFNVFIQRVAGSLSNGKNGTRA